MDTAKQEIVKGEGQLDQTVNEIRSLALGISVTDDASFAKAGDILKGVKDMSKTVVEFFAPMKKATYDAWKSVCARENEALAPISEAEVHLRKTMNAYADEQRRIREEEERKARAKAEEAARKERERLEAQAAKALEKGKFEQAESLLESAETTYAKPVESVVPVQSNTGTSKVGTSLRLVVEVTDIKAFIKELSNKGSAMTMIEVKQKALEAWVRANDVETFPGLSIRKESSINVR